MVGMIIQRFLELVQTNTKRAFWMVKGRYFEELAVAKASVSAQMRSGSACRPPRCFVIVLQGVGGYRMRSGNLWRHADKRCSLAGNKRVAWYLRICDNAIMRLNDRMAQSKGCREMGKRVRLKWPDRIKQPRKPVRFEQHTPFEERIFGKQITLEELRLRIEYRKGF